jgi:RecB family exonuclease
MMPHMNHAHLSPGLNLPDDFAFSQSSLQAYADCPRRFWLRYVEQLPWPAQEATPVQEHERQMRLGSAFHRLVQRAEIGLDPDLLAARLAAPLADWFRDYRTYRPADLPTELILVEQNVSVPFVDPASGRTFRLAALFDLVAVTPGERAVILDWKTGQHRPGPATLQQRLQSRVYPYVLVEAGDAMPGGPFAAHQVELRYWYTAAPAQPVRIRHSAAQHDAHRAYLQGLLASILAGRTDEDFPKAPDTEQNRARLCRFCVYRSRCDRGDTPGDLADLAEVEDERGAVADLEFTLDDLPTLAF